MRLRSPKPSAVLARQLDVATDHFPCGPGATERCDRESREGVWPALRGAFEQLRRPCPGRHRTGHRAAFFGAKTERDQRFERSAPASCVFHGKQSGGNRHDSWDGTLRACIEMFQAINAGILAAQEL